MPNLRTLVQLVFDKATGKKVEAEIANTTERGADEGARKAAKVSGWKTFKQSIRDAAREGFQEGLNEAELRRRGERGGKALGSGIGVGMLAVAKSFAGGLAVAFGLGKVVQFGKEAVDAFMDSTRASDEMRDSVREAGEAWFGFKASVGQAIVTMFGGEQGVDSLSDRIQALSRWIDENGATWEAWGTAIGDFARQVAREFALAKREIEVLVSFAQARWQEFKNMLPQMPGELPSGGRSAGAGGTWEAPRVRDVLPKGILASIRAEENLNALLERQKALRAALNDELAKGAPKRETIDRYRLQISETNSRIEELRRVDADAKRTAAEAERLTRKAEQAQRAGERAAAQAAREAEKAVRDAERAQRIADETAVRLGQAEQRRAERAGGERFGMGTFSTRSGNAEAPEIRTRPLGGRVADAFAKEQEKMREQVNATYDLWLDRHAAMESAAQGTAAGVVDAWAWAFGQIGQEGANLGSFIETLGRGMGAALLGGLSQLASGKVAENIARAFEQFALAASYAATPGLQLFAPGAAAAGKGFLLAAAKWGLVGGVAAAAGGAVGGGGGRGGGRYGDVHRGGGLYGKDAADRTQPHNITYVYVDPFNPSNPVHSRQVGKAVDLNVQLSGKPEWAR